MLEKDNQHDEILSVIEKVGLSRQGWLASKKKAGESHHHIVFSDLMKFRIDKTSLVCYYVFNLLLKVHILPSTPLPLNSFRAGILRCNGGDNHHFRKEPGQILIYLQTYRLKKRKPF